MKRFCLMVFAALLFGGCGAQATKKGWMSKYDMTPCDNPVFVPPANTVSGGRVRGAGINMNDGEAYSDSYINFSTEWHYAPKIGLCQEEESQWLRITGQEHAHLLKFSVKQINGCGAVVIYRDYEAQRGEPNLGQLLVTYDDEAQVLDVMSTGTFFDMEDLLEAACMGAYTFKPNMGGRHMEYTGPGKFTIFNYYYYTDSLERSCKWEEERDYVIDAQGLVSMTDCREKNRPKGLDAPWELRDISMLPSHESTAILDRLAALRPAMAGKESLLAWHNRLVRYLALRNMPGFLTWCHGHQGTPVSENALNVIFGEENPTLELIELLENTIEKLDSPAGEYWKKVVHDRVENQ